MQTKSTTETFPQLLNRLASVHFDRQTQSYIQQLEEVVEAARLVVDENQPIENLKNALSKLNAA